MIEVWWDRGSNRRTTCRGGEWRSRRKSKRRYRRWTGSREGDKRVRGSGREGAEEVEEEVGDGDRW